MTTNTNTKTTTNTHPRRRLRRFIKADEQSVLDAAEIALGEEYMDYHPHELARMAAVQDQLFKDGFDGISKFSGLQAMIDLHAGR